MHLLSGAGTQFTNFSNVQTTIVYETVSKSVVALLVLCVADTLQPSAKSAAKVFTRDVQPLDGVTRTATFRFKVSACDEFRTGFVVSNEAAGQRRHAKVAGLRAL